MKTVQIVVSGYIGFDNFGDEILLSVLLQNLKSEGVKITVISSNPSKTSFIHGVTSCKTFDILRVVTSILRSDILISGGGSLLQDKTSLKSLLYYLFVIFCAKFFRKKVIIFSQGIGPINNLFAKFITKYLLKNCDLLSVRDEKSLFLLRGWGIDNVALESDAVFNIDIPKYNPQNKIGIQLRSWKYLSEDFLNELANQIILNFSDKEILLFSFQNSLDYEICKKFQTKLLLKAPQLKTQIIQNDYPNNIIDNFKNIEYLIAMRFHACLLSTKFGIKTLAINYDEKVEKLAKSASLPILNLDEKCKIEQKILELKEMNVLQMLEFSNSQNFNFKEINELIESLK